MKKTLIGLLVGFILALPALFFLLYVFTLEGEYFFTTYFVMGLAFWIASFVAGVLVSRQASFTTSRWRAILILFVSAVGAWLLALMVLGLLSLTPLCIGQDSGDGSNDLALCALQVTLVAVFYSPPALFMLGLASGAAGLVAYSGRE
jgi:hypothetical protein